MTRSIGSFGGDVGANVARAARWELGSLSAALIGAGSELPVTDGIRRYVHLDNAATTPALARVKRAVERVLPLHAAVRRGAGFKAALSAELHERCRSEVAAFVGGDPEEDVVVFGASTSELVDVAARSITFGNDDVVMVTGLEHHSNDWPWRRAARVVRVEPDAQGFLSEDAVEAGLRRWRGRVKLLAVSGASNVTGTMPDTGALADLAHRHGARIFVDAAQLAGHRRLRMGAGERKLDFVVFCGHKLYAPFGSGALVGPRKTLEGTPPLLAGTPHLLGAVALAQACRTLGGTVMDAVTERERSLTRLLLAGLRRIPGVTLYGSPELERGRDRVGVVPFNVLGVPHQAVAESLSIRFGIAVGSGSFGAQPLVTRLLGCPELSFVDPVSEPVEVPGMVRASLGLCNDESDVEALCDAVSEIASDPGKARVSESERLQRLSDVEAFARDLLES